MPRMNPPRREELNELEPLFSAIESAMGFLPNSLLLMSRRPELVQAFAQLAMVLLGPGSGAPDAGLKQLVAHVASRASGCQYCMAHTAHAANNAGESAARIEHVWEFATHPLFTAAERAALTIAQGAAAVPNGVTDADFDALREHFDDAEILEIMGVISLFGFLNRWNDTLATELEAAPLAVGESYLADCGWSPRKHLGQDEK